MNKRIYILIAALCIALLIPTTAILIAWTNNPPAPAQQQIASATEPPQRDGWRGWWRRPDDDGRPPRGERRIEDGQPDRNGPPPFWRGRGRDDMMRRMDEMRRENPELAELYESMRRVDLKIREAIENLPKEKRENPDEEVIATLQPLFEQKIDFDIKRQQIEIDLMQEKLDRLKLFLEKKIEHKDQFIKMLIQRLPEDLKEERGRGFRFWGPPPGPPPALPMDEIMKEDQPKHD